MCNIISFDKVPYLFNPNDSTNPWVALNVPNPTLYQGGSSDFNFVATNMTLYQFIMANNSFVPILSLPNYEKFDVKNSQNQLIIIGSNSTAVNNTTYKVNQTVLTGVVLNGPQGFTTQIISSDNITGESMQTSIPVRTSPQLTKFSFFFKPPNSTVPQIVIKSIDYNQKKATNFTFQNTNEFM